MKKLLLSVLVLFAIIAFNPSTNAQTGFNSVLEYCTGTWCQWCPCGHSIINDILQSYPNTMVLAYHGPSNDPWTSTGLPMIQLFGFNAYPTGVVGRRSGIISRSGWNNSVVIQANTIQPGCSIALNNKSYNSGTRTITADVQLTALMNLTGTYYVQFLITEDNLVYPQTGNGSCPGSGTYVHKHVVRGIVNGTTGTLLNTTGDAWTQGNSVTVPLNYVLPAGLLPENCHINAFVYRGGGSYSVDNEVQQSKVEPVTSTVGIEPNNIPATYSLQQNYPNPFNPTTNIVFSVPKNEQVSLKFYDMMGKEIATYIDAVVPAGTYNAEIDASTWASGIYFYTLKTASFVETKKMTLVK